MVYRVYVEKRDTVATEPEELLKQIKIHLGIHDVSKVRIINRYDVEGIDEELFEKCIGTVFSEPQVDIVFRDLSSGLNEGDKYFAAAALPGQFDQRADSAAQCIQIISQGKRPEVRYSKVYVFEGELNDEELKFIKSQLINPIEQEEVSMEIPDTLRIEHESPDDVDVVCGFTELNEEGLLSFIEENGLAMDLGDILTVRDQFASEGRNPTVTEIRVLDTYWSDHCRHTTFNTILDEVKFEDEVVQETYEDYLSIRKKLGRTKPITLMDIATLAAKFLKADGRLDGLDESEEINACTVKIRAKIDGEDQDWLLLFKNETHNHPTEIEPFGGAATCIGGAIRDPLSGRAYVYNAMRITGAGNPLTSLEDTPSGKLPQRKIVTRAADGYSSYGNQIGVSTGLVNEIYHPGYVAKHMELGAVVGATPAVDVVRRRPEAGDKVLLVGGRTGRDGCGGATGSSKSQNVTSLIDAGAEVQKGNAPEERKLQRLFRNAEASRMIKRCNDFGAGGVSVAIGELASGLDIDLDKVPKKYEGLDGTELAISESQERMAVVIDDSDVNRFKEIASEENLEANVVAIVTEEPRLVMRWRGKVIVDIPRAFLDTNGAEKHAEAEAVHGTFENRKVSGGFTDNYKSMASDLNICSKRGLSERFDSTIGAGTVLMPWGGKYQRTPEQVMASKISTEADDCSTCSVMSYGFNPYISEQSPYHGAYLAVLESVCKLAAAGVYNDRIYLSFQEFFEKLGNDKKRWGKPLAALLGAFRAQRELGFAAIGGKDSMSGSYEDIDVPPSLISFAVTTAEIENIIASDFKAGGHEVWLITPKYGEDGLPVLSSLNANFALLNELSSGKHICSSYTPEFGGIAEAVMKMGFGNKIGFEYDVNTCVQDIFAYSYGSFILELEGDFSKTESAALAIRDGRMSRLGRTTEGDTIRLGNEAVKLEELLKISEDKLEIIYHCNIDQGSEQIPNLDHTCEKRHKYSGALLKGAEPRVLIPVFPGTNCEYDAAKALIRAGAEAKIFVIRNLTSDDIKRSIEQFASEIAMSQMILIPGGFSGGDEPDGSGKFITAFFRNAAIKEEVTRLLNDRDGLICGICNGFQALIKLGLVPYGYIRDMDEHCPTLDLNRIGRHQSMIAHVRVASNKSPWLAKTKPGDIYTMPISHGEGRLIADEALLRKLSDNGQIATQYVDLNGKPTYEVNYNPNDSVYAIEGLTSPDGRVFGKMGHLERSGNGLYRNVPGNYDMPMFDAAVEYFK